MAAIFGKLRSFGMQDFHCCWGRSVALRMDKAAE